MSVIARIKPKGLFKKKMSIQEIIGYTNLSYGVCDENYRLIENEIAKHTLLYDNAKPARGIDISMDEFDVVLQLSLPTTPSEIHLFYNTIQSLCNLYKVTTYIREEEKVHIKENEKFIRYDIEGSIEGLKDIESKIQKNTYQRFEIFGIYNPISIGINEINKFHHDLNQFEEYLHLTQSLDVYYAVPRVYKVHDRLVGIYAIGANIPSVIPKEPYIILNQIQGIHEWYVMVQEGKTIPYNDFINNVSNANYYDANHVIITLNETQIDDLVTKYEVKI